MVRVAVIFCRDSCYIKAYILPPCEVFYGMDIVDLFLAERSY